MHLFRLMKFTRNIIFRKASSKLGTTWKKGVPIEVIPMSYISVKNKIKNCLGGDAVLRMAVAKAVRKRLIYARVFAIRSMLALVGSCGY